MEPDTVARRRWLGGIALLLALAMLVLGETALEGRFSPVGFAVFWLVCVGLTVTAIGAALIDLRAIQRSTRREQNDLLEDTLKEIRTQARERRDGQPRG